MTDPLRINPNVAAITPPAIDHFNERIRVLEQEGNDVISLAQGVASFPPSEESMAAVEKVLRERWISLYSPDPGLLEAREVISKALSFKGLQLDPQGELLLTAGASQAFFLALLCLARPGDEILLPSPYYFDHQYACLAAACSVEEVPMKVENGVWRFDVAAILKGLRAGARIAVLVSPNNPTGAVMSKKDLQELSRGLEGCDGAIISDETYDRFNFQGEGEFLSPAALDGLKERTVVVGSFSKCLALAGWRIGYLHGPKTFVKEALKLQDSMMICAPVVSQVAAMAALKSGGVKVIEDRRRELLRRRDILRQGLSSIDSLHWLEPSGAFFAFPSLDDDLDDREVALSLLEKAHVAVIPGSAFGRHGRGHLRLSFGNVEAARLEEACRRVREFFQNELEN